MARRPFIPAGGGVRLTHNHFIGGMCAPVALDAVPEVPKDAAVYADQHNGDSVFDHDGRRWRFAPDGRLKFYCRYRPEDERSRLGAWSEAYAA